MLPDPISAISGGISIAQGFWQFIGYIRSIAGSSVISAYFSSKGVYLYGNDKVEVELHETNEPAVWWYSVKELEDYAFVRAPVIESAAHELVGLVKDTTNPDARYWRWVAQQRQGVIVGGNEPPNLLVEFIVIGYRPKAVIKYFSPAG